MPDPTLTWISSAPCRNVRADVYSRRTKKPHSTQRANFLTFSFDSTSVTFFEHVLTFYQRISGHIGS